MRRFRYPVVFFLVGVSVLVVSFLFVLWLERGLVYVNQATYQLGIAYRNFHQLAFVLFLVFFLVRSGFLLSRVYDRAGRNRKLPPMPPKE